MMGRQKKDRNHFSPNNKLVQEPEGSEKNRSPDPDSNETKINYDKESKEAHKNILKGEILQVINENFRDDTGYGQPKYTGDTQEIPRQQK
jgi:hypothetical protein